MSSSSDDSKQPHLLIFTFLQGILCAVGATQTGCRITHTKNTSSHSKESKTHISEYDYNLPAALHACSRRL